MTPYDALAIFLQFSLYAFLGWIMESIFRTVVEGHPVNSGFLSGPFIPIYGFGAVFITVTFDILEKFPPAITWLALFLVPTALEYLVSLLFESVFGLKLWDYSKHRFNLNGRICPLYSSFWIVLTVFLLTVLRPIAENIVLALSREATYFLGGALAAYFVMDTKHSASSYFNFSRFIAHLGELARRNDQLKIILDSGSRLPDELRRLLKPIRAFPELSLRIKERLPAIPEQARNRLEKALNLRFVTGSRRRERSAASAEDFRSYSKDILGSPLFLRLKEFPHHDKSIFEHAFSVSRLSFSFARLFRLKERETVRGALLHDYYLYDWRVSRPDSGKRHPFGHAEQALRNAERDFGPLSRLERDCIENHMWPMTIRMPRYAEGWAITIADKAVSVLEIYRMILGIIRKPLRKREKKTKVE